MRINWPSAILSVLAFCTLVVFVVLDAAVSSSVYAYIELNIGNSEQQASAYNLAVVSTVLIMAPLFMYHGVFAGWQDVWFVKFQFFVLTTAITDFGFVWTIASNVGVWDCWALVFISLTALLAIIVVDKPGSNGNANWLVSGIGTVAVFTTLMFNMWKTKSSLPMAGEVLYTLFLVWYHLRYLASAAASYMSGKGTYSVIGEEVDAADPRRFIMYLDGWMKVAFVIVSYFVSFYKRDDLPA